MSKSFSSSWQNSLHDAFSTHLSQKLEPIPDQFDRPRKLGLLQVLIILQATHFGGSACGGQSLEHAISDVGVELGERFGWGNLNSVSRQAFYEAVKKIDDQGFAQLEHLLCSIRSPSARASAVSERHGIRFLHGDGTQVMTPASKSCEEDFGRQKNGANAACYYPSFNLVLVTEAGSNKIIAHQINRCKDNEHYAGDLPTSERAAWEVMRDTMQKNDCFVADSGFSSYDLFYDMIESKQLFMIGIPKSWNLTTLFRAQQTADAVIAFTIPKRGPDTKHGGKSMRIRVFTIHDDTGATRYIATNLFDDFSLSDCRAVYKTHWAIEVLFRHLKQHLSLRQLRSKTSKGIRLELLAILIYLQITCSLQTAINHAINQPDDLFSSLKKGYQKTKIMAALKAAWCALCYAIEPYDNELFIKSRKRFRQTIDTRQAYIPGRTFPRISHNPHGVFKPKRPNKNLRKSLEKHRVSA